MAKTTSQIIAENKKKRAEEAAIDASRNAIHQRQMAEVGAKSAAKTAAVLKNAGIKTTTTPNTYEVNVVGDHTPRSKDSRQRLNVQKKKEDAIDSKYGIDSEKIKRDRTSKAYDEYVSTEGYRKKQAESVRAQQREMDKDESRVFAPTSDFSSPAPQDEMEARLRREKDQAEAAFHASEDRRTREAGRAEIDAMPEEDLALLDSYVRNRDNRQDVFVNDISWLLSNRKENDALKALTEKYGEDKALQLAEIYGMDLHEKNSADAASQGREGVNDGWISATAHNLLGIPARAMGNISGFMGRMSAEANRTGQFHGLPEYTAGDELSAYGGAVTEQTAQNIEGDVYDEEGNLIKDGGVLRDVASWGYQGAMSVVDSTARLAMSGGDSAIASAVAGMGTFSQSMQKYSAMGASPEQAYAAATMSAGIEYITEKLPMDEALKLLHCGGDTGVVKKVLTQAFLVEPSSEELNLFANMAMEAKVLGEKSSKEQRIGDLIAGGLTRDQAEQQFWKETWMEALETYAVSAFAGLLGGGSAAYAGNQVQMQQEQQQTLDPAADIAAPVADGAEQVQQEAQAPVLTDKDLVQLGMDSTAAGLQETAPAAAPVEPMTEHQQNLQMAFKDVMGWQEQQEQTTKAVTNPIESYPPEKQRMIRSYIQAVDTKIKDFVQRVKSGDKTFRREKIGDVSDRAAKDIGQILGVDVAGYTHNINTNGVQHIINRHGGKEGGHDNTLELADDVARIGWVLENYDRVEPLIEDGEQIYSGEFGNNQTGPAPQIRFVKKIDGYYYVVEAAFENKHHKLWVQSARLQKNNGDVTQAPAEGPSANHETNARSALTSPSPTDIVSENIPEVNDNSSERQVPRVESSDRNVNASASSPQTEDSGTMPAEGGQITAPGAVEANFTGKAAYANLLQEGNVQPDRPGDVRPMEVPKTDGNGKRVTEFAANAYGAGATTDEMASTIESLIQDGELGFNVRTNRESLDNAAAVISKRGAAEARNQITRNISKGKIRDGDIEQGILLYARYAEKGDNDNASEMLVDLAQMANITGRNLQMFKLLRRMTVEGQVMTLEKEVHRSVESMIRSGQVKKGYEPSFDPQMMDGYRKALEELRLAKTPETQESAKLKAKQTQEALYADAAAKMPATFKAKWDAWRYMAMLGNAKTQIRNLAGNAAFMPYKEVKDKMGALAEKVLVPKDQRTKSLTTDRGLLQWARDDRKNNESVRDALKYSAAIGDDITSQKIRDDMKVFNTKALESLRGFVNKVPQAGDMLFKNGYYERSLAGFLRGRGYTAADIQSGKVTEAVLNEARSYAVQEAMKATFNDCNAFSDFLATELRYKGDNPVGKVLNVAAEGVLPFRRTPANIAVRFTEYSPVGVAKGLWNAATKVRSGEMTAATAIDQLTAGLTGSAVMALGYALAEGLGGVKITGSGTDEDEKRQGHQDYALEFSMDGQEYSYKIDWAAPANLPLFVGANIYNALNGAGEAKDVSAFTSFLRGMQTMFEPLLALSCMSSLNDLLEGIRYAEEGEATYTVVAKAATSYFTQGIPALARQHYQSKQEYKQTTFTTSDDPTIRDLQQTASGLGVSDAYKTDKVDVWGQKEYQGSKFERNLNAFFNPGTLKKIDNSTVEQEITRLNNAGHNVSPNTAARTISYIDKDGYGHDDVRLTEEQFQTLAQTQGQTARKLVEDMISSKDYAGMTDAQKAEAIDTAYLYARKTGEITAIDDHTGYDQAWMMDVEKKGASEILRRVLNSDLNTSMSDLDTAWDKGYKEENFSRALQSAFDSFSKATPAMQKQVYAEAEGTTKKYLEARSKGISHIDFLEVAESIAKVKGTGAINKDTGKATVRDIDRRKAIANTKGMTDKEIDIVMKTYMGDYDPKDESPETTEFKYQYAREELGLSPKEYVSTYQAYLDNDKKAQKIAAIRALGYDYRTANALYKLYYGRMKNDLIEMYG